MGLFDAPNTLPGAPEWDAWYDLEEDFNQVEEGIVINDHSLMDVTYTSPAETDEEYKKRLAEAEQKLAEKREKHDQKRQEWLEKKNQINDMMNKAVPHKEYQEGDLIVLKVSFGGSERTYCYLTMNDNIFPGEKVIVPVKKEKKEVIVEERLYYSPDDTPMPIGYMKSEVE